MPFANGTSVTFTTENEEVNIGTVKGFDNGIYQIETNDGKITEVEESEVKEFQIQMQNRGFFETFK
ncbi:hypothetical protein BJX70DRAFT_379431 [Aspergillus crustosus]